MKQRLAGPSAPVLPRGGQLRSSLLVCLLTGSLLASLVPTAAAQTPVPGSLLQLAATLAREGTYVSPRLNAEVPFEVEARLQRQLDAASLRGITLRLAILDQVPTPYRQLDELTSALYAALALPDSVLVVAIPHGVSASSDRLPSTEVEQQVAFGRAIFERDGYIKALEAVADGLVSAALVLAPPPDPLAPVAASTQPPERVFERRPGDGPLGIPLAGLLFLAILAGGYAWLARRIWSQQLGSVLVTQALAEARLEEQERAGRARSVETARRSLQVGTQALDALRSLPWWKRWLTPWAPPPQLRLAERAFGGVLQLLGPVDSGSQAPSIGQGTPTSAPLERPVASGPASQPVPLRSLPLGAELSTLPDAAPTAGSRSETAHPPGGDADETLRGTLPAADVAALLRPTASAVETRAPEARPRRGWFGRKARSGAATPTASLAPEHVLSGLRPEEPLACFFCGCPLGAHQVQVGRVALAGQPLQPLLCARHAAALTADQRPAVWARVLAGETVVPWFRDPGYAPGWDYDPEITEPTLAWDALPPPDELLAQPLRVVVHADDPRWIDAAPPGSTSSSVEPHHRAG